MKLLRKYWLLAILAALCSAAGWLLTRQGGPVIPERALSVYYSLPPAAEL